MHGVADSLNVSVTPRSCSTRRAASARDAASQRRCTIGDGYVRLRDHRRRPGRRGRRPQGPRARRHRRHRRPAVVRRVVPAHRLHAVEVAAQRRRVHAAKRRRYPWSTRLRATRLHGQPPGRRGRARRQRPRQGLEDAGAVDVPRARRGSPAAAGSRSATTARRTSSTAATSSSPSARRSKAPPIEGLDGDPALDEPRGDARPRAAASLLVLGGGPTGCELAQVYARFGVPVTIVQSGPRLIPTDHPRNAEAVADGARARRGRRPARACGRGGEAGAGTRRRARDRARRRLDRRGPRVLLAVGRDVPARRSRAGALRDRHDRADARSRATAGSGSPRACGSSATRPVPELHTHQAHYQGELAARMALGEDVTPDYRALPRATYTDPEAAFVGMSLEQARAAGLDAFELVADFPKTRRRATRSRRRRPRHDRGGPRHARAGRCGDGLPGRLGGHPRMRAGDQGAGPDRRPRRHDPRLPVDVADLQRPVRRRAPELAKGAGTRSGD